MSGIEASRPGSRRAARRGTLAWVSALCLVAVLPAQVPTDQAAAMVLNSARQAYNEKNHAFAIARFREFLTKFGNHKEVPSARYGLALALLESPEKDHAAAVAELQQLVGNKELPEHPYVLYYLGQAQRGLGTRELATAHAKPQEAPQRRAQANQRFEDAARHFAAALTAFQTRLKPTEPWTALEFEWAARSRCDLAEMQLRTLKNKEAHATTLPFEKDPVLARSRYRNLGLYYHGFASFLLKDYQSAGRALNQLTPFNDPVYGTHARYLLARTHHLANDEQAEAVLHYEGVLNDYARQKQAAVEALKRPDLLKNNPDEKARLEALVKDPAPDHVARASFFCGVRRYEEGKFAEALARFADFPRLYAGSPLLAEAQLRQGFCHVQLKQFKEAQNVLGPLVAQEPRLADQALFWIGKAQAGAAEPNNAQALSTALATLRQAAERAQQLASSDPDARQRRGEILLELADTQQQAKQYKEAVATYNQLLNEKSLPERAEELFQRQVTALHLAGDYLGSDQACVRFRQTYPRSVLLPAVLFRHAENAHFVALAAERNPNLPNRVQELARLNDEAIKRYQEVVDKFPEFQLVNLARYGLGLAYYRKGDIDRAQVTLARVPQPDRTGELAVVSYLLADCLIRQAPTTVDDALAAGKVQDQLKSAVAQLDAFLGAQPAAPQAPDALLKLGHCHQRLAALLVKPEERRQVLGSARSAYEKLLKDFPRDPLQPQAFFERAKCLAQAGDLNGAINELQRFHADPLRTASIAPLALLHLATLLRGQVNPADVVNFQKKAADAAGILAQCRQQYESVLLKDPARADWVPLLQYHHGVALREAGKLPEARAVFEQAFKQGLTRIEAAESALRFAQCLKEEGAQKIAAARKVLTTATPPSKEGEERLTAARKSLEAGLKDLRESVAFLETHINQLKDKQPTWEVRARMLYDAAWASRSLAEFEVADARGKIQQELWKKRQEEIAKQTPKGASAVTIPLPEVPMSAVPLQPSEQKARAFYQALIANFSDLSLAIDARFELAELHADRNDHDEAIKLLNAGLEKEPAGDLADKIRLRLGDCLMDKGDVKGALGEFESVAANPKSPLSGQGHYRAGECRMKLKEYAKAADHFVVFRDQPLYQNLPGLTDRALLRLGQAYAQLNQWEPSRQALENMAGRFPGSPWVHDARYGIGWAWQNQKNYDNAVTAYSRVTAGTIAEIAAKAQLQIGLCRLEQKRFPEASTALLIVPFTYDYPELSAVALCEAARSLVEVKQNEQAARLLQRVLKDHPKSPWAEVARQRLEKLGGG